MAIMNEITPIQREASDAEQASARQEMDSKYGPAVAEALYNYGLASTATSEQREQAQAVLAETLATILESGSHMEKVQAIKAIFDYVDTNIEAVDNRRQSQFAPM